MLLTSEQPKNIRHLAFMIWRASDARLPRPQVMDLSELDFSYEVFRGTKANLFPLASTLWREAKLRQTEFDHVDLGSAVFDKSIASRSIWNACRLVGTKWPETELTGSRWRNCKIEPDAFDKTVRVREAINCKVGSAEWQTRKWQEATNWRPIRDGHQGWVYTVALGVIGGRHVIL